MNASTSMPTRPAGSGSVSSRRFASRSTTGRCVRFAMACAAASVAAVALGFTPPASAAEGDLSWGVQPSSPTGPDGRADLPFQVAPGSVITDWVAVTNYSPVSATFRVYAADAMTDYDTAAFTLINADQASTGAGAWTTIDGGPAVCADTEDEAERACAATLGTSVTLEPGARVDVPFTLTVPQDATPGDHAAGIVASLVSGTATEGGTGVTLEQRVGTRIYLRIDGPLSPGVGVQGAVAGYTGSLNPLAGGTARSGFDVRNLGNTRVSVQPEVRLTGPFGMGLGSFALEPVRNIVPGGVAHVEAELPGIPPLFLVTADVTLTPIAADGIAAADPLPPAVDTSAVAWAVPWMLLAALGAIGGAIALLVWRRRRSRALLAEDLAAYAEQIRAEERAAGVAHDPFLESTPQHESEVLR
ncbi:hypothetical protein ACFXQA_14565 [Microbacterium sp. P07]|uniref:hypothetical protein n=1 Tax=Microbacterium sp. P07 TaxID=3366952 RepID=UPI003745296A